MDLGIRGKWALVCGASKGLGYGCAIVAGAGGRQSGDQRALGAAAARGGRAHRRRDRRDGGGGGVRHHHAGRPGRIAGGGPQIDILVNNAGGPPPGDFRNFTRETGSRAIDANMLTPIELIKATVDEMIERRFGRIVNITSSSVKAPIDVLGLSNGARSGLTGFVAGVARKTVAHNVTINNLLPGSFDTDRIRATLGRDRRRRRAVDVERGDRGRGCRRSRPDASATPTSSARPAPTCAARRRLRDRAELPDRRRPVSRHLLIAATVFQTHARRTQNDQGDPSRAEPAGRR